MKGVFKMLSNHKFETAKKYGISFKVVPSDDTNPVLCQNIKFLEKYILSDTKVSDNVEAAIRSILSLKPEGILLNELKGCAGNDFNVDDIYYLIAQQKIYLNLYKFLIEEENTTKVFMDYQHYQIFPKDQVDFLNNNTVIGTVHTCFQDIRKNRLPDQTKKLIDKKIAERNCSIKKKTVQTLFMELSLECQEKGIKPPSYSTFHRALIQSDNPNFVKNIKKVANNSEDHNNIAQYTPKPDRIFEMGLIYHTELDIQLVSSNEGKNLGRPWLSVLVDSFSNKILAFYLTFAPPSYISIMVLMRECVRKHNRLPNSLAYDSRKEFQSVDLDSLLASYSVKRRLIPGNKIEQTFGNFNKLFIPTLFNDIQVINDKDKVNKNVNTMAFRVWTLEMLNEKLNQWFNIVYNQKIHPEFFLPIIEVFEQNIKETTSKRFDYIPYDDDFILKTLPVPPSRQLIVNSKRGIKLNNIYYWSPKLMLIFSGVKHSKKVLVKYDPLNTDFIYAFINNKWEKCKYFHLS